MASEVRGGGGGGEYKPRICSVCGGEFKNGRALGGHMRVHFPTPREESIAAAGYKKALKPTHTIKFKKEQEDKRVNINGNQNPAAGTGSVNCLLCSKSFPSMKAMYGHMRCHPERWWRGSRPPPSAAYAGGDDDDDIDRVDSAGGAGDSLSPLSEVINSISPLVSWPSTIKKGRNGAKLSVMEDKEFREGVANLVHLSRAKIGDDKCCDDIINLDSQSSDDELLKSSPESKTSNGSTAIQEFADKCISTCNPVEMMSTLEDDDDDDDDDELGSKITKDLKELNISDERPPGHIFKINIDNQKRKKMKLQTADSDSSPAPAKQSYRRRSSMEESSSSKVVKMIKCSYCPMSFSTHNGLGGHMSRHRNERNPSSIDQESSTTSATTATIKEEIHHPKSPQTQQKKRKETQEIGFGQIDMMGIIIGSQHQCEICKRYFSSGQALGGHKKYHRPTPPIIPVAIEENTMMREGAGSSANHRDRFLGIDLNLMPPPEEEEEEDEVRGGGGGGSSGILQLKLSAF